MRTLFFLMIFLVNRYHAQCQTNVANSEVQIKGLLVRRTFPIPDTLVNNVWISKNPIRDDTRIYFYNGIILIESSYYYSRKNGKFDTEINFFNGEKKYYSVLCSENSAKCLVIDSLRIKNIYKLASKDSCLKREWIFNTGIDSLVSSINQEPISNRTDSDGNRTATWIITPKCAEMISGQVSLTFSKRRRNFSDYSISKNAESRFEAELVKAVAISDMKCFVEGKEQHARLEFSYEVEELKIENETELKRIFALADKLK